MVTSVDSLSTYRGEAFVAQVQLDGELFGTFENQGCGGPTGFSPAPSGDAPGLFRQRNETWEVFAAACDFSDERVASGAPWQTDGHRRVHKDDVAEMLIQEYDTAMFVASATARRRVCVRVFSTTTGFCNEMLGVDMLRMPYQAAMDDALRRVISRQPAEHLLWEGDVWQVWTG